LPSALDGRAGAGDVRHSLYCLATDLLDEGAATVFAHARGRAGVDEVTVAAKYHAAFDVYPHNPLRRVAAVAPGVYYRPDPDRYADEPIRAVASATAGGRDVLAEACAQGESEGVDVAAWVVLLHHDEASRGGPGLARNCFGDELAGILCPASPASARFAELVVGDVCAYPVTTVRLESFHYHGLSHGRHHERLLELYGRATTFLLGVCFCDGCVAAAGDAGIDAQALGARVRAAVAEDLAGRRESRPLSLDALAEACGEDLPALLGVREHVVTRLAGRLASVAARAGVRLSLIEPTVASGSYATGRRDVAAEQVARLELGLGVGALCTSGLDVEITGYLADAQDLARVLDSLGAAGRRGTRGVEQSAMPARGRVSVVLRPGPPDGADTASLRAKVDVARRAGCREVSFYAYGLYRLDALDRIGAALA
jgi:hypothetical protein